MNYPMVWLLHRINWRYKQVQVIGADPVSNYSGVGGKESLDRDIRLHGLRQDRLGVFKSLLESR